MLHKEVKIHEVFLKEILKRFESIFNLSIEYSFLQNANDIGDKK
jgi:hypothetical protein